MTPTSRWIQVPCPRPRARLRLYCLPYAGSGTAVYRGWPEALGEHVEVRIVVLPGRERRFSEPAVPSVEGLADLLVPALLAWLEPPLAIFGHSLGGLLGCEVAHRLTGAGQPPVRLIASGCRAPHLPAGQAYHRLPDAELLTEIRVLGGGPPELLANRELLQLMLPTLRADFTAAETYRRLPDPRLPCPITAIGGAGDPMVARSESAAWAEHTSAEFRLHELPGDHFFLNSARPALLRLVAGELADPGT